MNSEIVEVLEVAITDTKCGKSIDSPCNEAEYLFLNDFCILDSWTKKLVFAKQTFLDS